MLLLPLSIVFIRSIILGRLDLDINTYGNPNILLFIKVCKLSKLLTARSLVRII